MTEQYLGAVGIAEALQVSRHAAHKWRSRYPQESRHPFPEPDVEIDGIPGWRPDRLEEIVQWRAGLPGRGRGGGRPSTVVQEFIAVAARYGFDRDEALRTLDTFTEEFPDMSREEVGAWLIEKWRS